jgi:hypothetical protein
MIRVTLILLFSFGLMACGESGDASQQSNASAAPESAQDAPTAQAFAATNFEPGDYPSLPTSWADVLVSTCDAIDVIFYHIGISINMTDPPSIIRGLRFIGAENPKLPANCQPAGRFFFQADGENILEADFYLSNGCLYFIFMEKGKPAYGNIMTDEGVMYFNNVLRQAGILGQGEAIVR